MSDSCSWIDLAGLAYEAEEGQLYQVADTLTATALLGAQFVLVNGNSKGIPVRVISARVSITSPVGLTLGWVAADPALAAGNPATNMRLGGAAAEAINEAAVAAAPTIAGKMNLPNLSINTELELLLPGSVFLASGQALAISSAAVASTISVVWLWAEVPV